MDANASSVLFITCSQTRSPPHIGRLVLVEWPIPLLNAFAYSFPLFASWRLPHCLSFFRFSPSSTPPLFLPLIHLLLLQYLHTSSPSFFFPFISSLIQPLSLSGSPIPLLLFALSQSKPWIRHLIYYSPFTSHALEYFLSVRRMQSALIHCCNFFSSTVLWSFWRHLFQEVGIPAASLNETLEETSPTHLSYSGCLIKQTLELLTR